jgi:hypothetical protein
MAGIHESWSESSDTVVGLLVVAVSDGESICVVMVGGSHEFVERHNLFLELVDGSNCFTKVLRVRFNTVTVVAITLKGDYRVRHDRGVIRVLGVRRIRVTDIVVSRMRSLNIMVAVLVVVVVLLVMVVLV